MVIPSLKIIHRLVPCNDTAETHFHQTLFQGRGDACCVRLPRCEGNATLTCDPVPISVREGPPDRQKGLFAKAHRVDLAFSDKMPIISTQDICLDRTTLMKWINKAVMSIRFFGQRGRRLAPLFRYTELRPISHVVVARGRNVATSSEQKRRRRWLRK